MAESALAETAKEPTAGVTRGLLSELLGYHLRRAQVAIFKHFCQTVGAAENITPGLLGMLEMISSNPGLSQSRLAEAMEVDRSTIVTTIDQLEGRGFVIRGRSPTDRRSYCLELTGKGRAAIRRMEVSALRHEEDFAAHLTGREREELIRLLVKLYTGRDRQ